MLKSMTGYGKGVFEEGGQKFSVEIKAVNNKYCELNLRLPRLFNPLEERVRKLLSATISRGRVDIYLSFENRSESASRIKYNKAMATAYNQALQDLSLDIKLRPDHNILFELIAKFPDIIEIDREFGEDEIEGLWQGAKTALEAALAQFSLMREREGLALKQDLDFRLGKAAELLDIVEEKSPEVVQNHRNKLKKRMEEALAGVAAIDEARFLNEVAHFTDKSDISEEIARMKSHIAQFYTIMGDGGAVGRKLDFLTQEMAREANTIGSKANLIDISKIALELKSEIEKIREQVQNVE
jgi:uncharacterized protein (TIGR00255 family)